MRRWDKLPVKGSYATVHAHEHTCAGLLCCADRTPLLPMQARFVVIATNVSGGFDTPSAESPIVTVGA